MQMGLSWEIDNKGKRQAGETSKISEQALGDELSLGIIISKPMDIRYVTLENILETYVNDGEIKGVDRIATGFTIFTVEFIF